MVIYKTTNLVNGKIYIGQDSKNNPNYYGSGSILNLAIKKYGKENFKKEILEHCFSINELNDKEMYWILELKSYERNIGYNIRHGGGQHDRNHHPLKNRVFTEEHKKNISKNHHDVKGENNPMYGKTHTDKVKKILSEKNKGKKYSVVINKKKGRVGEKNSKAKLTESQVLEIRRLYFEKNETQKNIANIFNIDQTQVSRIVLYKQWTLI